MSAAAQLRITRLAANTAIHRAFRWLHLHQPQMRQWQLELLRIPAPTFSERARAEWFLRAFQSIGLDAVRMDEAGNVLAELPCPADTRPPDGSYPVASRPAAPVVLVSAHLDTVFPPGTPTDPTESEDGTIHAPGACDNAAGLSALLGLAAGLKASGLSRHATILFAANVGEEGEGDLLGMRHLFTAGDYAGRISAAIALEGGGTAALITQALASVRFRVSAAGPGGHSWTNAGTLNPVLQLAKGLLALESLDQFAPEPGKPRTTLNVGLFAGGTSINSIPELATAHLDLRSSDPEHLERTAGQVRSTLQQALSPEIALTIDPIGKRPGGFLPADSPLLATLRAVDRHLGLPTEPALGSTDANIPLSLGIPAAAMGTGGVGGGIHTLQEWYNPANREPALRRILLTLVDTAQRVDEAGPEYSIGYTA